MLFGPPTPLEFIIVWLVLAVIAVGLLFGVIKLVKVALRRYEVGSTARNFILSGGAAAVIAAVVLGIVWATSLDGLERDCRRHIVAEPSMADANGLSAERHYDFWNYGASGGGFVAPWSVPPHTEPKIVMLLSFNRGDSRLHQAWIECYYARRPDTGDPPKLDFDKVRVSWENVLIDNRFVPWHPPHEGK